MMLTNQMKRIKVLQYKEKTVKLVKQANKNLFKKSKSLRSIHLNKVRNQSLKTHRKIK